MGCGGFDAVLGGDENARVIGGNADVVQVDVAADAALHLDAISVAVAVGCLPPRLGAIHVLDAGVLNDKAGARAAGNVDAVGARSAGIVDMDAIDKGGSANSIELEGAGLAGLGLEVNPQYLDIVATLDLDLTKIDRCLGGIDEDHVLRG